MDEINPSNLPEIDEVHVHDLLGLDVNAPDSVAKWESSPTHRVAGNEALKVANLFRKLPDGDMRRCHTPPVGLRFFANSAEVGNATLCWACNNLFGQIGDKRLGFAFDGTSRTARKLLDLLERLIGHSFQG